MMLMLPSLKKAPWYGTMWEQDDWCSVRSSWMMFFRTSACTFICTILIAKKLPVGTWSARCTTPLLPLPTTPRICRSSSATSKAPDKEDVPPSEPREVLHTSPVPERSMASLSALPPALSPAPDALGCAPPRPPSREFPRDPPALSPPLPLPPRSPVPPPVPPSPSAPAPPLPPFPFSLPAAVPSRRSDAADMRSPCRLI
mmetsp:Transcript_4153/g.10085  ORF Transcript_4153/g.10085 Transcript_4153/m.10085 type:complete len:200 (-) Transcript_4153:479-1078(-)